MVKLTKDYADIKIKQEAGSFGSTSNEARAQLVAQFVGAVGIGIGVRALREIHLKRKLTEDRILREQMLANNISASLFKGEEKTVMTDAAANYDTNGLNYLNRWEIIFGNNKLLTEDELKLLSVSAQEWETPGPEISIAGQDLGFTMDDDVSDIKNSPFSVTFRYDRALKLALAFTAIYEKMKNRVTGRYGYKDDFKFDVISVLIYNNFNALVHAKFFENSVISGDSGLAGNQNESSIQTRQVSFTYDRFAEF